MPQNLLDYLDKQIKLIWAESDVWLEFIDAMHQALLFSDSPSGNNRVSDGWALLPGLCCQAAGGDPDWADDLAGAWYLFYAAANLMDKVQDQDELDERWVKPGPGVALNAASGLFFTSSLLLDRLHDNEFTGPRASVVIDEFYRGFLRMCNGQHKDLLCPQPGLENFWDIAAGKSGSFFSMACRSGARLATENSSKLDGYGKFGNSLGILLQILDELEELRQLKCSNSPEAWLKFSRSLPVIYALEVLPASSAEQLQENLRIASENREAADESLEMIEQSGAALYIEAEIERQRVNAAQGLAQASTLSPAGQKLHALLHSLVPSRQKKSHL